MEYLKVKKQFDNFSLEKRLIYVANELFTKKEAEKYQVNLKYCDVVVVKKNNTSFFFGARFDYTERLKKIKQGF